MFKHTQTIVLSVFDHFVNPESEEEIDIIIPVSKADASKGPKVYKTDGSSIQKITINVLSTIIENVCNRLTISNSFWAPS